MEYLVLIYEHEKRWDDLDDAGREAIYEGHGEFGRKLVEHGHTLRTTSELQASPTARTVRGTADEFIVTDGPFAESAEQLGGFYIIGTDDLDDLTALTALMSFGRPIEIRPIAS